MCRANLRPEIGVFELLTTTSITSDTGKARRLDLGDDPGLPSEPVLLGDNEKNLYRKNKHEHRNSGFWEGHSHAHPDRFGYALESTQGTPSFELILQLRFGHVVCSQSPTSQCRPRQRAADVLV